MYHPRYYQGVLVLKRIGVLNLVSSVCPWVSCVVVLSAFLLCCCVVCVLVVSVVLSAFLLAKQAVDGDHSEALPNWSTVPNWLYDGRFLFYPVLFSPCLPSWLYDSLFYPVLFDSSFYLVCFACCWWSSLVIHLFPSLILDMISLTRKGDLQSQTIILCVCRSCTNPPRGFC